MLDARILTDLEFFYSLNACHNGLGELATYLRLFAKTVTIYPSPIDGTCKV